jgi:iron complex transport system substrate-binding protein
MDLALGNRAAGAGGKRGVKRVLPVLLLFTASAGAAEHPRMVSLAPNITEIVYAAGAGPSLVGTVEYSDYPVAARELPRVGDGWQVDVERVLALRPDLVLAWSTGTPQRTIEKLEAVGLRVESVQTQRLADVPAALRRLGALAGSPREAEAAATRFESEIQRLRERYAGASSVSVFIQIDDQPLYTVGGRHVINEAVTLCGGRNVFGDLRQVAPTVDLEAVLARDPQVILSTDDTIAEPAADWQRWPRMTAVKVGAVYSLPADLVARATPRLAEGVALACAALDDARRRLELPTTR